MDTLRRVVEERVRRKEAVALDLDAIADITEVAQLVGRLADLLPRELVAAVQRRKADEAAATAVSGMGRVWWGGEAERLEVLQDDGDELVAAVSGFAALQLLRPEAGVHVLEIPGADGARARRERVRVTVAADPPGPPGARTSAEPAAARRALAAAAAGRARIVRRYRDQPAPLVRDVARGWRTGRLDDVLAGGFDLMEP